MKIFTSKKCLICKKEFSYYSTPSKLKEGGGKYCSNGCKRLARKRQPKKMVDRICQYCQKEFKARISEAKRRGGVKFCSRECFNSFLHKSGRSMESRKKQGLTLTGRKFSEERKKHISEGSKGKILTEEHKRKISLSKMGKPSGRLGKKFSLKTRQKLSINHKGSKSHFWQGGITQVNTKIRHSFEYKLWREAVYKRDNFVCQWCNQVGGNLNADHYPIAFNTLINEIINIYGLENLYENALSYERLWDINNGRTLCKKCHEKTDTYLKGRIKVLKI